MGSPDFKIGISLAIFIKGGKIPKFSETLHKCVMSGVRLLTYYKPKNASARGSGKNESADSMSVAITLHVLTLKSASSGFGSAARRGFSSMSGPIRQHMLADSFLPPPGAEVFFGL